MKKILIVDDKPEFVDRYKRAVEELGNFTVYTASSVHEGIEKALQVKPDIAILDKNLPDGLGDSIAEKIREVNPQAKIAGFTAGSPNDFSEKYFDVREHKVSAERCKSILQGLLHPQSWSNKTLYEFQQGIMQNIMAMDILIQGYDIAQQVKTGIQPVQGIELKVDPEKINQVLDLPDVGLQTPAEFYEVIMAGIDGVIAQNPPQLLRSELQAFRESPKIRRLMQNLENKDFLAVEQNRDYKVFHERFVKLFGAIDNVLIEK